MSVTMTQGEFNRLLAASREAEALRAERDRLREALTSIAEFSNEPEAMMAADALATPAPVAPAEPER